MFLYMKFIIDYKICASLTLTLLYNKHLCSYGLFFLVPVSYDAIKSS